MKKAKKNTLCDIELRKIEQARGRENENAV